MESVFQMNSGCDAKTRGENTLEVQDIMECTCFIDTLFCYFEKSKAAILY